MADIANLFRDGGPFMYAVLGFTVFFLLLSLLFLILTGLKRRVPTAVWVLPPVLIVVVGALGWYAGLQQVIQALSFAAPEARQQLLFAGLGEASGVSWAALFSSALLATTSALMVSIGLMIGAGNTAKRTLRGGLVPAFLPGLTALGIGAWLVSQRAALPVWLIPANLCLLTLAIFLAGLKETDEEAASRRLAGGRMSVALLSLVALGSTLLFCTNYTNSHLYKGLSMASPEYVAMLIGVGAMETVHASIAGIAAILALLLALFWFGARSFKHLRTTGSYVGAAATTLVLLGATVAWNLVTRAEHGIFTTSDVYGATEIAKRVPELPATHPNQEPVGVAYTDIGLIWEGAGWVVAGHETNETDIGDGARETSVGSATESPRRVLLAAPASVPAARLFELSPPLQLSEGVEPTRLVMTRRASPDDLPRSVFLDWFHLDTVEFGPWDAANETNAPSLESGFDGSALPRSENGTSLDAIQATLFVVEGELGADGKSSGSPKKTTLRTADQPPEVIDDRGKLEETLQTVLSVHQPSIIAFVPGTSWTFQDLVDLCGMVHARASDSEFGEPTPRVACALATEVPASLLHSAPPGSTGLTRSSAPATSDSKVSPSRNPPNAAVGSVAERGRHVTVKNLAVAGPVEKETVEQTILANLDEVEACFQKELANSPTLSGKLFFRFNITAEGAVRFMKVRRSSIDDATLEQCVSNRVRQWHFAEPGKKAPTVVRCTFEFSYY